MNISCKLDKKVYFAVVDVYMFFCQMDLSISDRGVLKHRWLHLFVQFYQFLPLIFWCSAVRYIRIKNFYDFLKN